MRKTEKGPSSREIELERLLSQHGITVPRDPSPARQEKSCEPAPPRRRSPSPPTPKQRRTPLVSDERSQPLDRPTFTPNTSALLETALEPTGLEAFVEATTQLEAAARSQPAPPMPIPRMGSTSSNSPNPTAFPVPRLQSTTSPNFPSSSHSFSRSAHADERELLYDDGLSSGTLVIAAGRSKYFGPRAGNEWLKNVSARGLARLPQMAANGQQEIDEPEEEPLQSRPLSQEPSSDNGTTSDAAFYRKIDKACKSFPFASSSRNLSISSLLKRLPQESQGRALLDSYFRYFTWS